MCLCAIHLIILHSFYRARAVRVSARLQNDNVKYSRCWRQSEPTAISNSAYPVTCDFNSKPKYNCFQTVPLPLPETLHRFSYQHKNLMLWFASQWSSQFLALLTCLLTLAVAREAWKIQPERGRVVQYSDIVRFMSLCNRHHKVSPSPNP